MSEHDPRPGGRVVPTFSVVMPAYNTEETIREAMESVLEQTDPDFELIVVDDGSTDATAEAVEAIEDPRVRLIRQDNRGAAAARNTAVSAAGGPLVAFIDSDDLWLPSYLAAMRARFEQDPGLALCYSDAWVIDPVSRRVGSATAMQWQRPPEVPPEDSETFLLELLDRNFIFTATVVRRTVLQEIGGFDETLQAAIDYEMWLRIVANGYRAGRLPGLHAAYRRGRPGSISSSRVRTYSNLLTVYRKVSEAYDVSPAARARAQSRAAWAEREVAALRGGITPNRIWRVVIRPRLVRARNWALRRDRWLTLPPRELVDAFPGLMGGYRRARP